MMSYFDIVENLIPADNLTEKDIVSKYIIALGYLNEIKCYRYNAMYFGSMSIGPDVYGYDDITDFDYKYTSCCIYIMGDLYDKMKGNMNELVEVSVSILYSMLALYMNKIDKLSNNAEKKISKLININNKFRDNKLKNEFKKEVKVGR